MKPRATGYVKVIWPSEFDIVRKNFRNKYIGADDTSYMWWVSVLVVICYSLFLWILLVFTMVQGDLAMFREFWSLPGFYGVSNFQISLIVGFLYTAFLLFSFVGERRTADTWPMGLSFVYAANLCIVAVWFVNFY